VSYERSTCRHDRDGDARGADRDEGREARLRALEHVVDLDDGGWDCFTDDLDDFAAQPLGLGVEGCAEKSHVAEEPRRVDKWLEAAEDEPDLAREGPVASVPVNVPNEHTLQPIARKYRREKGARDSGPTNREIARNAEYVGPDVEEAEARGGKEARFGSERRGGQVGQQGEDGGLHRHALS
jgi:hypothetical protein